MTEVANDEATLRAAIVGYGLAGSVFHAPLIAATPGMRVAAIVTRDPRRRAQAEHDFPEAQILYGADDVWAHASEFDLAVIATPNRWHVPLGLAAIEAGLPVAIDKPIAASLQGARELAEAARAHGTPLTVFQNRRWDGDFRSVRHILERDLLGRVIRFESRFERYRPQPKPGAWRELPDPEEGGGLLLDLGSHLIDQALVLFGSPTSVYAEVGVYRPGAEVDDDTFVALEFPSGVHAHLWMSTVVRILGPRFHVSGLRGSYSKYQLDPQEPALKAGMRPGDTNWGMEPPETWGTLSAEVQGLHMDGPVETLPGAYEQFYAQLRDALRGDAPLPVDPSESVATMEVVEAARRSARERQIVSLAPS